MFFDSLWKSFDSRFDGILASLARHKDLLTKEVTAIDLVEARESRAKAQEDLDAREKKRSDTYLHDTVAWLNIATESQDDELDRLLAKRLDGTCDWIFRNAKMKEWIDDAHGQPVLWVKGIPGAGKFLRSKFRIIDNDLIRQNDTLYLSHRKNPGRATDKSNDNCILHLQQLHKRKEPCCRNNEKPYFAIVETEHRASGLCL